MIKNLIKGKWGYLFILPKLTFFLIFIALPILAGFAIAFLDYGVFEITWAGLANFKEVFTGDLFRIALWNTFRFVIVVVPSQITIALIVATLIHPLNNKAQSFFRGAFYLPVVTSIVVMSMVWRWMYHPHGLLNFFLSTFNIDPINWLGSPTWALPSIILMAILTPPGVGIIILLAAMGAIPESLYDAAKIDGAGPITSWWNITLPLLKPSILFLLVIGTIASFQVFAQVLLLTDGGPGFATTTIVHLIFSTAFRDFNFGLASAQAVILFIIVLTFALIQFKFLSTDVEY